MRKKRQDDGEEYVCPMNVEMPKSSSFQRGARIYEENLDHLEQVNEVSACLLFTSLVCRLTFLFGYFFGRWKTLKGLSERSEPFLRGSTT